jgi:phosphoenolpyruvate carboxylase
MPNARPTAFHSPDELVSWAEGVMIEEATRIAVDPQTNSVFRLAYRIFAGLEAEEMTVEELGAMGAVCHIRELEGRIGRFRDQHIALSSDDPWANVRTRLLAWAKDGLETYAGNIARLTGGIVFTAHPTFAMSPALRRAFAASATRPSSETFELANACVRSGEAVSSHAITLSEEHAEVQAALAHAIAAINVFNRLSLEIAREAFPTDWRMLAPRFVTLASWVGYDLDGRTDIHWSQSLGFRLREKASQLGRYHAILSDLIRRQTSEGDPRLQALCARLEGARAQTQREAEAFSLDLTDPDALVKAANLQTEDTANALTDAAEITAVLDSVIIDPTTPDELAIEMIVLRAMVETCQLGTARIHLRINAAQIRTVLRRDLGLEVEDQQLGRVAFAELGEQFSTTPSRAINYADLFFERTTARRQFMLCAQILKHIDAGSPIRFLVAECENPATMIGALYLARQYGVDHKLDLSPLFETPEALDRGGRFVERLLEDANFCAYIQKRGYLSIQLGFSDSGRFVGQVSGNMAIERIHRLVGRALSAKGLYVDILIFNTHGESMGRGAYPGTFKQRFDHLLTPHVRSVFAKDDLHPIHEVSFQGGDGFLHFATPELAEATLIGFVEHLIETPLEQVDPFYTRRDLTWDIYRGLRIWHERLLDDPDYQQVLSGFALGFPVNAGSRKRKRPDAGAGGPRALRAISHNAVLQQLAIPANTACGLGTSAIAEVDRLAELADRSPRMRALIDLAVAARSVSSVPVLRAYANQADPGYWIALAKLTSNDDKAAGYQRVAEAFIPQGVEVSLRRLANRLTVDLSRLDRIIAALKDAPDVSFRHQRRINMHLMHALRIALMMRANTLVARIPRLSDRHNVSIADLLRLTSEMKLDETVRLLEQIFPISADVGNVFDQMSEPGYVNPGEIPRGYEVLHREVIAPLRQIDLILQSLSVGISHAYGAYG